MNEQRGAGDPLYWRALKTSVRWFVKLLTVQTDVLRLQGRVDEWIGLCRKLVKASERHEIRLDETDKRIKSEVEARVRAVLAEEIRLEVERQIKALPRPPGKG